MIPYLFGRKQRTRANGGGNLYPSPVLFEGKLYPTAEHAYQAGKARKPEVREWILNAPSPSLAAMAAHGLYTWDVIPNWAEIKFDRMRRVLRAKFKQHADLREILLDTPQTGSALDQSQNWEMARTALH